MKKILFLAATLSIINSGKAMDSNELTPKEEACYTWFKELSKTLPSSFLALSPEDRAIFEHQIKYQDNPAAVTKSRYNFAEIFMQQAHQAGKELLYDTSMLQKTLVKMTKIMHGQDIKKPTNLLTARMYAFSTLLTDQERKTYSQENYLKDPNATKMVVEKWSELVCNELIALQQLPESQKSQMQKELFQEVIDRFERTYK